MWCALIEFAQRAPARLSQWLKRRIFSNPVVSIRLVQEWPACNWDFYIFTKRRYSLGWKMAHSSDNVNECKDWCNELSGGLFGLHYSRNMRRNLPILLEYNATGKERRA